MDIKKVPNEHASRKHRQRIVLIGIYHDKEKGILVTRKEDGTFQLPGGKISSFLKSKSKKQLRNQVAKITRTIFERTGLSLDCFDPEEESYIVKIPDPQTKIPKIYMVFIMEQNSTPGNAEWIRNSSYEGIYMPANLGTIITLYPGLSYQDLYILAKYLDIDTKEIFKLQMRPKLQVVKTA